MLLNIFHYNYAFKEKTRFEKKIFLALLLLSVSLSSSYKCHMVKIECLLHYFNCNHAFKSKRVFYFICAFGHYPDNFPQTLSRSALHSYVKLVIYYIYLETTLHLFVLCTCLIFSDAPYIVRGVSTYQDVCESVCLSVRSFE